MKIKLLSLSLLAVIGLGACETTEGYRKQLTQYQGQTTQELIQEWGKPDTVNRLEDGREIWIYKASKDLPRGGYFDHRYYRTSAKFENQDGKVETRRFIESRKVWVPRYTLKSVCNTQFIVHHDNVVEEFSFRGNGCLASEWGI
ncbi:hypothetical protein [Hirschia maritima]|uniref:hypothetical protein n=1 Tax=Hirschia maritima TaxID=1121961 RepID=UPI0003758FA9|nr:hypothetical protein [Hirschia maritima]